MAYNSLADFLEELAAAGELVRIAAEVDAAGEIAEITRQVASQRGPALLFERVNGQAAAVVTNLLGTERRVCRALAVESLDEIAGKVEELIRLNTPQNWFDRLRTSSDQAGAEKFRPKAAKNGACQQVVRLGRDVDLTAMPLVQSWPAETGPAITAGLWISSGGAADASVRGVSTGVLARLDATRLAVIDDGQSAFARHFAQYQAAGEKMPLAVVLGGDPAGAVSAQLDLPESIDPFHMTGLLRGAALDIVTCRTLSLEVPAGADVVLEGYLDPNEPLVNVSVAGAGGSYLRTCQAPVFNVAAVTHRTHGIFSAVIDSGHLGEAQALVKARERMLLAALRSVAPDVVDLHLPIYGGPHRFAFVAIRKRVPFGARQIASALWGSAGLRFTRFLVLVDEHVNVHDTPHVLSEVGANVSPERDLFSYDGPAHGVDLAQTGSQLARHLGIDATAKMPGEQAGERPAPLVVSAELRQRIAERWNEFKIDLPGRPNTP